MIAFERLWPLALLAAAPAIAWLRARSATTLSRRLTGASAALRTAVLVLVVLALTEPVWHRASRRLALVYAVDVSESVDPAAVEATLRWLETEAPRGDLPPRYVVFADGARLVDEADALRAAAVVAGHSRGAALGQRGTRLEEAIDLALAALPTRALGRIVLFTDGNETQGDAARALALARRRGVRIVPVVLPPRTAPVDVWVEAVDAPERVRRDEPVPVRVVLGATAPTRGTVVVAVDGTTLATSSVAIPAGESAVELVVRPPAPGEATLAVRVEAEADASSTNDAAYRAMSVAERPRVLHVEGRPSSAVYLRRALRAQGFDVRTVPPAALGAEDLGGFDAVVLSDVPARTLSSAAMAALAAYVRDEGGGVVFVAGESSFGEEGYAETPVEALLPARFRVTERHRDLALMIVLDKSYSMIGEKIELAKEATLAALDLLDDEHRFGVVTFNWDPFVTVPLQIVEGHRASIAEAVGKIRASAQTNLYPALKSAFLQLRETDAKVKHVILLSDGKTYPDDYEGLVREMTAEEITISTVAVGVEADRALLEDIAEWGGGRSYYIEDARRVPQIFIEETRRSMAETLVEEPFRPVVRARVRALEGIDLDAAPPLKGYVNLEAKPTAEILLETPDEAPLLLRWRYGLGRAVVFASDAKNRWAVDWLGWKDFARFWGQLVRDTLRPVVRPPVRLDVVARGDEALVSLVRDDAGTIDGGPARPEVELVAPDGRVRLLRLDREAPGLYRARAALEPARDRPYRFVVATEAVAETAAVFFHPFSAEERYLRPNETLLATLAAATGGVVRTAPPTAADLGPGPDEATTVPTPLAPIGFALALGLYLLDVFLRRAGWLLAPPRAAAEETSSR